MSGDKVKASTILNYFCNFVFFNRVQNFLSDEHYLVLTIPIGYLSFIGFLETIVICLNLVYKLWKIQNKHKSKTYHFY